MKRSVLAAVSVTLGLTVVAAVAFYLRQQLRVPHSAGVSPVLIEISPGSGTRAVVRQLRTHNIIPNEYLALGYVVFSGNSKKLQAGEYLFDRPMSVPEVVGKLVLGSVHLRKFTIPEGLTTSETAMQWQQQGFGSAEEFVKAAQGGLALIQDLDREAASLEGYLFPETYSFPVRTPAKQAVEAMVGRFRNVIADVQKRVPSEQWPLTLRRTVILASLIEAEAAHQVERPIIASVYLNRLNLNMLLQCDPTVIYGLELAHRYTGRLTLKDLKFNSPYNTYVHPGLPPGAIANPGAASIEAAAKPGVSKYLYFVRTEGGHHTFSESLAAHNRAVAKYRAMQARH